MNYPEYVLRRSETLWRDLEETWQRELATAAGVMHERGAEVAAAEEETVEVENTRGENAVKRLAEKIFSTGSETAAEAAQRLTEQERETRSLAEGFGANNSRGGSGGARWLADELRRGTTEGIAPERVQGSEAGFAPTYEMADLQTLSQSVERDARRYDGGFLLY